MEEYLDLKQLRERIPFGRTAIEELIVNGVLIEGIHFRRPTGPGGKRIFFWSAIEAWLKGQDFQLRRNYAAGLGTRRNHLHGLSLEGSAVSAVNGNGSNRGQ